MSNTPITLGHPIRLKTDFNTAVENVTVALKSEGFGVLTEIDVQETLKKKLDVDFRPFKILGACNPPLAYKALSTAPVVGLLLPCNVTVAQVDEGTIEVSLVDPLFMLGVISHPGLEPVASDARARLVRVMAALIKHN
ncbi:MAG: DUF302 domain-containing protein [Chloroflexota bacterium]|nr:MAG: DUF302 domain-containing protein [Chloroflexota bacterium]